MFRTLYNRAKLVIRVEPDTPILIKSGREAFDPTRPDMEFIRTRTDFGAEVPFLPGSSIKGVMRAHAERILRSLCSDNGKLREWACNITGGDEEKCVQARSDKPHPYKDHCYACRTFGLTTLASRVRITDAYPWPIGADQGERIRSANRVQLEERPGVMIDRRTGTGQHPRFYEVCTEGQFYAEVFVHNYQLWQLALLALVIRDMNLGYQRLGASKSRGLGKVKIAVEDFEIHQFGRLAEGEAMVRGIGSLEELREEYDLLEEDEMNLPADSLRPCEEEWFGQAFKPADKERVTECWEGLAKALVAGRNWQNLVQKGRNA
jgi:CRISPR-associated RAMP protein (TIGR02581 family)